MDFWQLLAIILLVILGPLVPAYLLYRALPADATVSGPFKGLNINLQGAFAGYFVLFLVVVALIKSLVGPIEIWHISGRVKFEDGEDINPETAQITVNPSAKIEPDGTFEMNVAKQVDSSGTKRLPLILVDLPNKSDKQQQPIYQTAVLHPSDGDDIDPEKTSKWHKLIAFKPKMLKKAPGALPKYASTGPAPTPLASPPTPPPSTP